MFIKMILYKIIALNFGGIVCVLNIRNRHLSPIIKPKNITSMDGIDYYSKILIGSFLKGGIYGLCFPIMMAKMYYDYTYDLNAFRRHLVPFSIYNSNMPIFGDNRSRILTR